MNNICDIRKSRQNFLLQVLFSTMVTLGLSSAWYQFPMEEKGRKQNVPKYGAYQSLHQMESSH